MIYLRSSVFVRPRRFLMEDHLKILDFRCRVGNCVIDPNESSCSKNIFKAEFLRLFDVDILQDDAFIHPQVVCNKHRCILLRAQNVHNRNELYRPIDTEIYAFFPHVHNECEICIPTKIRPPKRGRPSKKTGGPGKYKRKSCSPQGNLENLNDNDFSELDAAKEMFKSMKDSDNKKEFLRFLVAELMDEEVEYLCELIGEVIEKPVKADAERLTCVYKDIDKLKQYDISNAVSSSNKALVKFIKSVAGVKQYSQRQLYHIAHVIEMIYKLSYSNSVYPLAFLNNLHAYVAEMW